MKSLKRDNSQLLSELISLIESTKNHIASSANSALTILFWHIGNKINENILSTKRADYGKQIVVTLSRELVGQFGRTYEEKNLRRMIQFAKVFTDFENVVTLSREFDGCVVLKKVYRFNIN